MNNFFTSKNFIELIFMLCLHVLIRKFPEG